MSESPPPLFDHEWDEMMLREAMPINQMWESDEDIYNPGDY